jgi:hypothetical protein
VVFLLKISLPGCIEIRMQNNAPIHEKIPEEETAKIGSDRIFGFLVAFIFIIIGVYPLWNDKAVVVWSLVAAGGVACVALILPRLLHPLNIVWCRFGRALHFIMTPLIMGLIFFLVFTPFSLAFRLFGREAMPCKFDPDASSYWVAYSSRGPASESMRDQF